MLLAGPGAVLRAKARESRSAAPLVLCWNENPYGPSPAARAAVSQSIAEGCRYPSDEEIDALTGALAAREGMSAEHIVTATGSGELLRALGLIYGRDGNNYLVVASKGGAPEDPGWYKNLLAHPDVKIQVWDKVIPVRARPATNSLRSRGWRVRRRCK